VRRQGCRLVVHFVVYPAATFELGLFILLCCINMGYLLTYLLTYTFTSFFYVLLTVHLSIFISVINQLDAQNFALQ